MPFTPARRTGLEYLDLPPEEYGAEELAGTLADIRIINRYLGDHRAILKHLKKTAAGAGALAILDVATGSGDIPVAIARWARKAGVGARVTAVDINESTVRVAREQTAKYPEISVEVADGLRLPHPDKSFDFVLCCKTTHHLSHQQIVALIREMSRVGRRGYFILELRRSWVAYGLICFLTRLFTRNRLTRHDGPLSVLKGFTAGELAALAREAGTPRVTVYREPFWLLVLAGEIR